MATTEYLTAPPLTETTQNEAVVGSLEALYRRHIPQAVSLAYLMTSDYAAAQDIAHDAFLLVSGRAFSIRAGSAFSSYLRKTVIRCVLMRERASTRERQRLLRSEHLRTADGGDLTGGVERRLDLLMAMRCLTVRQRAAVVLRYWHDLPEREIATILKCRVGTVKSMLARSMATLRQELSNVSI